MLAKERVDAVVHNFRAAFVAGLALGLEKELLLLQSGDDPVPLDYQDLVRPFRFPNQIDEAVASFSPAISARFQLAAPPLITEPKTLLERLNLGASAAENELQELGYYFLETDEFRRTLRGEIKIGRKGSGKTAVFAQIRDNIREDKRNVVLDLKPEGFQLLKFKERVLDYLEEGTKEHTVTAFWEYLLLLEICHKLLAKDRSLHMRDQRLYAPYRKLADTYYQDDFISEGDFAERMQKLKDRIADDFGATFKDEHQKRILETGEITELLYKHDVARLRSDVMEYLEFKSSLWILFDNLDKGWPPYGIQPQDVLTLRCLLDAMVKIQKELRREDIECHGVVFIRNDVYELLVANTPDRGKVPSVILDWTDADLLRELLRRRFLYGDGLDSEMSFDAIWTSIVISHINGEETSQYLIDRSLMRPRALIELIRHCRSHAVNLRHERIELADIEQGEEAYSSDLLSTVDFEISDISPAASNILYEFIEAPVTMSGSAVREMLLRKVGKDGWEHVLDLLFWYGFLGFIREDGEPAYIYSVKYDIRRLHAIVNKKGLENAALTINPAFWRALEVRR
ncbi:MAG: P-loop ATPase, Sll1717 family [Pyrinomonadaceae bacterium]